ncbi:MAG: VapC-like toxin [Thermoprotei archaeon]|nr:MAG: VapC-like toxin [Thermoprotei archaeon]RLF23917.1 MAG: VapC-like toxin [Thermoprotei archaeon]
MRSLLRRKRVYIDTDIFIYVALKHPDFYRDCYNVLNMLVTKEFSGYGSHLVLFELFGALSRISVEAAYEAVNSYLDLPLTMLELNRETFDYAREIARLSKVTYDSLHAALVAQNDVDIVVSEDIEDWSRILRVWPKVKEKLKVKDLTLISPTKGVIKVE